MKIWMVIFIGSRIFAVWHDPMPVNMTLADCQIKAGRWTQSQAVKLEPEDQPVFACVQRWFRPRRGEIAGRISQQSQTGDGK